MISLDFKEKCENLIKHVDSELEKKIARYKLDFFSRSSVRRCNTFQMLMISIISIVAVEAPDHGKEKKSSACPCTEINFILHLIWRHCIKKSFSRLIFSLCCAVFFTYKQIKMDTERKSYTILISCKFGTCWCSSNCFRLIVVHFTFFDFFHCRFNKSYIHSRHISIMLERIIVIFAPRHSCDCFRHM